VKHDDGGPAFQANSPDGREAYSGMTLVDWFAGQIVSGMMASWPDGGEVKPDKTAEVAYRIAAEMVAEKRRREAGEER